MQIIWHGQFCFQIIASSKGKNNLVTIVIDLFDETSGLRVPKLTADIFLSTHNNINTKAILGSPFVVDGPGEYEIKNVFIQGIDSEFNSNTIYIVEVEGIRVCHLGNLTQKELTTEQIEEIGNVDILMVPIGGFNVISAKEAVGIIAQIEPKIIIPMYFQLPKLKSNLDNLDKFLKLTGTKAVDSQNKLLIKKGDLPAEESKIVILNP